MWNRVGVVTVLVLLFGLVDCAQEEKSSEFEQMVLEERRSEFKCTLLRAIRHNDAETIGRALASRERPQLYHRFLCNTYSMIEHAFRCGNLDVMTAFMKNLHKIEERKKAFTEVVLSKSAPEKIESIKTLFVRFAKQDMYDDSLSAVTNLRGVDWSDKDYREVIKALIVLGARPDYETMRDEKTKIFVRNKVKEQSLRRAIRRYHFRCAIKPHLPDSLVGLAQEYV